MLQVDVVSWEISQYIAEMFRNEKPREKDMFS